MFSCSSLLVGFHWSLAGMCTLIQALGQKRAETRIPKTRIQQDTRPYLNLLGFGELETSSFEQLFCPQFHVQIPPIILLF